MSKNSNKENRPKTQRTINGPSPVVITDSDLPVDKSPIVHVENEVHTSNELIESPPPDFIKQAPITSNDIN